MSSSSINLTSSALDVGAIVDNLINIDSAPVRSMQSKVTAFQSKASAYQTLNTKLSALSDKVNILLYGDTTEPIVTPYSFSDRLSGSVFSKSSVSSSDENVISATASTANTAGTYSINVSSLAQARTMTSSGFADTTSAATGTGTITITSGSGAPKIVTINSSNSTLKGVRDAINNANANVTATIINDGSATPYKLLITANDTGMANSFTITDSLSGGQALGLTQAQAAADAQFMVNGVSVTKSSNTISDVITGVSFTLKKQTSGPVALSIKKDTDAIVSAVNDFVTAYNAVNSFFTSQFTYNASSKSAGVLSGDATLRSIQSNLQNQFLQSISNRFTSYSIAGQVGLNFGRDGSLSLDETKLRDAISSNFTSVAALFLGDGTPAGGVSATDSRVTYNAKTYATQEGTYSVQVDSLAQQAAAVGNQIITNLSDDETLTITYGSATAIVSLLQNDSLSAVLSKINGSFSEQGLAATATDDGTGRIKIATNNYGSSQAISIVSDRDDFSGTTGFGTVPINATGVDIAGTINGNDGVGDGLTLTGASGQPEEGLSFSVAQTTTGRYGAITVAPPSKGMEGSSILMNLFSTLGGITDPLSGPIHSATDGINRSISSINDQISAYQERLDKERELLTQQFSQADQALRLMSVTQANLSSQLGSLSKG
jgi:flagellar hook-associated protein 2